MTPREPSPVAGYLASYFAELDDEVGASDEAARRADDWLDDPTPTEDDWEDWEEDDDD